MPSVEQEAVPALESTVEAVEDLLPIVKELRPYTTDFLGGPFRGFGGTTSSYYDANGRYQRISFVGSGFTLAPGLGGVVLQQPEDGGVAGYESFQRNRCPGAATQPHPDGSNPWRESSTFPCDLDQGPK
jgi:hypothetical protein